MSGILKKARKGFTLLELIVVIVILGILAAIAIPTFASVITKSKDASSTQSLRSLNRNVLAIAGFDAGTGGDVNTAGLEAAIKELTLPGASAAATPVSGTAAITDSSKIGYATNATGYSLAMRSQSGACLMLVNSSGATTLFKSSPSDTSACTGSRALAGKQSADADVASGGVAAVVVPSAPAVNESFTALTQTWTVPATGSYMLSAVGASGGYALYSNGNNNPGGRAAQVSGTFTLNKDAVIKIVVGRPGGDMSRTDRAGGGGGGTYIYNQTTSTPLLIAGGGGGAGQYADLGAKDASLTTTSKNGTVNQAGLGNSGGYGGGQGPYAGGGGGLYTNGRSSSAGGGASYADGSTGGVGAGGGEGANGGFGGGGGSYAGGGGGGGYSGGGAGGWSMSGDGGGGSSFNSGTDTTAVLSSTSGAGSAKITSK